MEKKIQTEGQRDRERFLKTEGGVTQRHRDGETQRFLTQRARRTGGGGQGAHRLKLRLATARLRPLTMASSIR